MGTDIRSMEAGEVRGGVWQGETQGELLLSGYRSPVQSLTLGRGVSIFNYQRSAITMALSPVCSGYSPRMSTSGQWAHCLGQDKALFSFPSGKT